MTALLWAVAALLAAGWSLLVWAATSLTGWLLGSIPPDSTGQLSDVVRQLPAPTVPEVLAPWIDVSAWAALQTMAADLLAWLSPWLPSASSVMDWVAPLAWTVWGLGLLMLLTVTGLLHWLIRRVMPRPLSPAPHGA